MTILKIKQAGLLLRIGERAQIRTPVRVDITNLDLNTVLAQLRQQGVFDFTISSNVKEKQIKNQKKSKKIKEESNQYLEKKLSNLEQLIYQVLEKQNNINIPQQDNSDLQTMIQKVLDKQDKEPKVIHVSGGEAIITDGTEEEQEDAFIPTIDTNELKLEGDSIKKVEGEDMSETADLLKQLTNKTKKGEKKK